MKKIILLFTFITTLTMTSRGQTVVCPPNIDFELGDYSGWLFYTGTCCPMNTTTPLLTPPSTYFALTSGAGVDACCSFPVVGAGIYSLKLGSTLTTNRAEKAAYYVHVPVGSSSYSLIYRYAYVLQIVGHAAAQEARFVITATDSATGAILVNSTYSTGATGTFAGSCTMGGSTPICKSWTTQTINLSGYNGSTIIVSFSAGDCGTGGHYGYGYVDMNCGLFAIGVFGSCSSSVLLTAPAGFATYAWYDSATFSTLYGTNDSIYVTPTVPTTYAVIITPNPGFGSPDTLYTTVYPGGGTATVPITGNTSVCVGNTTPLSNTIAGGTWTSSSTSVATVDINTGVVSGVSPGTSVITYANSCSSPTFTITVGYQPGQIMGTAGPCTNSYDSVYNTAPGGVWSISNTSIATIGVNGDVHTLAIGTTIISYTTACGVATRTVSITSKSPLNIFGNTVMPGARVYLCVGGTTTLSNDGIPTGTWSSSNTNIATIDPITGVMTSTGGTGTCTITTKNICNHVSRYVTLIVQSPTAISGITTLCQGATTTLSNGTSPGTWSSGNPAIATIDPVTGVVHPVPGGSAGTVPITYTLIGGCFVSTVVTITSSPALIVPATSICLGYSVTLSSTTPGGTWSSGSPAVATMTGSAVTGTGGGTSVISYTLPGGCAGTTTITVRQPPGSISGPSSVCAGSVITLSNSVPGGTWSSASPGMATASANTGAIGGVSAGDAVISYTTGSGGNCMVTATITVNPAPDTISGNTDVCLGSSTMLSNTVSGGTWSSSNGTVATISPSGAISGVGAGTSVISYIMPGGCYSTATVTIKQPPSNISGATTVCTGSSIILSNAVAGGTWSSASPGVATIGTGIGIVGGVSAGDAVISYTTASGGNCTVTTTVTVLSAPVAGTITGPSSVCAGDTIALTDTVNGGVWSSSAPVVATVSATGTVTGGSAGSTVISYTITSPMCGPVSATKIITVQASPNAGTITGPDHVCTGSSITLSAAAAGGIWSSSNGLATVTGGVVSGLSAGTVTISYTVTNACGTAIAIKSIMVDLTPPAGVITGQNKACSGIFTLNETVTGGIWSSSAAGVATIDSLSGQVHAISHGTAVITYTTGSATACPGIATYTVTVTDGPTFTVDSVVSQIKCYGENNGSISVTVHDAVRPLSYVWSNNSNDSVITGLDTGLYILNIHEPGTQCIGAYGFHISEPDSLHVTAETTKDICKTGTGTIVTAVSGGAGYYTYNWSNNNSGSELQSLHAGTYTVTVTDSNGCVKTITALVEDNDCSDIKIHDAITPNGDGVNDTWVIEGIQSYPANSVQVFDKWGDLVYEKTNYNNDWGGRGKSGLLPDGTYYYLVKLNAKNATGGNDTFTGTVLIKR